MNPIDSRVNRIEKRSDGKPEEDPAGDYYLLGSPGALFWITAESAAQVGRALSRIWPRRWLRFVDRNGSRAWVRAGLVEFIEESTTLQRERSRAFRRALRREAKADRRWGEDDDRE